MKRIILSIFLIVLTTLIIGCNNQTTVEYDLTGEIHEINQNFNDSAIYGTILVENKETKIYLKVTNDTILTKNSTEVEFEVLSLNQTVEVKIDGPVAESWPLQGTAGVINIFE